VIVTAPLRAPAAVGVKVTVIVQVMPAGTPLPHVLLSPKSPLGTMLVMLSGWLPASSNATD